MTTPTFISGQVGFGQIRYYTQFDPYFFSVDNRPLGDLALNDAIVAGASDAGRRANMMEEIGTATDSMVRFGIARYVTGLALSNPSGNVLRVGPGLDYEPIAVNASDARTVQKRGVFPFSADFSIPAPGSSNSIIYLVQGRYVDFGSASPATTSNYPLWDSTNTYLPTSLLNGELQISTVAGATATTGSEVAPAATAGWFPIYNVTVVGTGTSFTAAYNASAPLSAGLSQKITNPVNLGTASTVAVGDTPANSMPDSATSGVIFSVFLNSGNLNPYKPIKLLLGFSPSVSSNNFVLRTKYQVIGNGDTVNAPSYTTLTNDVVAAGTIDTYVAYTTINGAIPASIIQTAITNGKKRITVAIERLGSDGSDSNTGTFRLIDISAIQ